MGESIIFLKEGKKIWEGNSGTFHHSGVPALEEFLSTKLF
jgi:phospholipid/cholesterol/gamma-HCH transport system ATP-binding protein